jgi:hypothetical protein
VLSTWTECTRNELGRTPHRLLGCTARGHVTF